MAIPIMLITLGVAVARLRISSMATPVALSLVKSAICVACALLAGIWFNLEPVALGILILQLATPVAVTSYMLAEKYGADSDSVAGLVVISTLTSVLILPLVLAFVV
jgi:predicted permease